MPVLLRDNRGRRHKHRLPRLTKKQILAWADAWRERTGQYPGVLSGEIPGTGSETWLAVNSALYFGRRGLPGGDSLLKLLRPTGRRACAPRLAPAAGRGMLGDAGQPADAFRPGAVIAAARAVYRGRGAENHLFGVGEPCRRRAMNGQGEGGHSNQAVVLASYAECCEQV